MDTVYTPNRLAVQTALLTVSRTAVNTNFRMVYPLLPVFARGVGVEIGAIATVLTFTQLIGLAAPVMGELAERRSKRFNIVAGLGLNAVGLGMVFIIPGFAGMATALILGAAGKSALFDPAAQAYIGDRVRYERRGLYMGLMELSWSAAFLLGVPAMAWLIELYGWRAPFGALALLSAVGTIAAMMLLDVDEDTTKTGQPMLRNLRVAVSTRSAIAGLVLGFGISSANQLIAVVFGTWIELNYGVALAALAVASAVIGGSELLGEGFVAGFADRIGKQRIVAAGIMLNIVACVLLPLSGPNLAGALVVLFLFFLGFEVSLVGSIPLASELAPNTRAMYMTLMVAAFTGGRAAVTQPAVWLFGLGGITANSAGAIVLNVVALVAVLWGINLNKNKALG